MAGVADVPLGWPGDWRVRLGVVASGLAGMGSVSAATHRLDRGQGLRWEGIDHVEDIKIDGDGLNVAFPARSCLVDDLQR